MARNKFLKDLETGNNGENKLLDFLNSKNVKCKKGDGKKSDILLEDERVIEVKFDIMSAKTNNIALEFYNSKQNKPSGISNTISNFWVFVLPCGQIWLSKTEELLRFSNNEAPLRIVFGAGDKNADLKLYKKEHILNTCFTRIDEFDEAGLKQLMGIL